MTGPQHYKRAEELLADITNDDGSVSFGDGGEACALAAIGHGLLALAAATWFNDGDAPAPGMRDEWWHAAGEDGGDR
jgi:hypothetical protein